MASAASATGADSRGASARPHLLAVVGLAGAGKSTVSKLVVAHGYERVYFGGFVVDEVARRGMAPGQASESSIREELRAAHGMGAIAVLAEPRLRELLDAGTSVVIDGLYSRAESLLLAAHFPLVHLAVHASTWVRAARMQGRAERPLTPDELAARDVREIELLDKAPPIATAETHLVNDGTAADLEPEVAAAVARLRHFVGERWPG